MESLLTGMLSKMGENGIAKIAESAGVDAGMAKTILAQAGPLLSSKMADNAKSEEGLNSLNGALESHDGSIFNNIDDLVNPEVDTKGSSILGHILGNKTADLAGALAAKNGTSSDSTSKLLEMAAPLVLGQLGSQKKEGSLDAGAIFNLLQGEKKQVNSADNGMIVDLAEKFLDKDGDGSVVDDVLGMAGKFFK